MDHEQYGARVYNGGLEAEDLVGFRGKPPEVKRFLSIFVQKGQLQPAPVWSVIKHQAVDGGWRFAKSSPTVLATYCANACRA